MEAITPFERDMERAAKRLRLCAMTLGKAKEAYRQRDMREAYQAAFEFAYQAEKLTLLARGLPAWTGRKAAGQKMERQIRKIIPIQVGYTAEGWFGIDLPGLLPKKERGGVDYLRQNLYLVLGDFFKTTRPPRMAECVLTVCHRYDRQRPERKLRDHDNIEINAVVDALALYALTDDAPLGCSHHYCSVADDRDAVTVLLVPNGDFPAWYARRMEEPQSLLPVHKPSPDASPKHTSFSS